MSNIYCASCFHKNEYSGVRPTICENCDKPFARAFEIEKPAKAAHHPRHGHDSSYQNSVEDVEVDEFLSSASLDIDTGVRPGRRSGQKPDAPTIKSVNSALGGSGGEIAQRDIPDLAPSLQTEGKVKSLSSVKSDYMKDMLAQAKQVQAQQTSQPTAPASPPKSTRRRKSR